MSDRQWGILNGDPDVVADKAASYTAVAEAIKRSRRKLKAIADDSENLSEAIAALAELAEMVRADIGKAHERYAETGEALTTYSTGLRHAKEQSDPAAQRLYELRGEASAAETAYSNAKDAADHAETQLARAKQDTATKPERLEVLREKVRAARAELASAESVQADVQAEIERYEKVWVAGHKDKHAAGRVAVDAIQDATTGPNAKGLNNTLWDQVSGILEDIARFLSMGSALLAYGGRGKAHEAIAVLMKAIRQVGKKGGTAVAVRTLLLALITAIPFTGGGAIGKLGQRIINRAPKIAAKLLKANPGQAESIVRRVNNKYGFPLPVVGKFTLFTAESRSGNGGKEPKRPGGEVRQDPKRPGGEVRQDPKRPGGDDGRMDPKRPGGDDGRMDPKRPGGDDGRMDPKRPGGDDGRMDPKRPGGSGTDVVVCDPVPPVGIGSNTYTVLNRSTPNHPDPPWVDMRLQFSGWVGQA